MWGLVPGLQGPPHPVVTTNYVTIIIVIIIIVIVIITKRCSLKKAMPSSRSRCGAVPHGGTVV